MSYVFHGGENRRGRSKISIDIVVILIIAVFFCIRCIVVLNNYRERGAYAYVQLLNFCMPVVEELNYDASDYAENNLSIKNVILQSFGLSNLRFQDIVNNELSLIALEDTEITMISYDKIINRCEKNCPYHNILINNMLQIIIDKLNLSYERIQILTKKTIREKLLEYFKFEANKKHSKKFKMSLSFTSLAEYLAVDRSALMREVKYLKEDELLEINNKIVKINF